MYARESKKHNFPYKKNDLSLFLCASASRVLSCEIAVIEAGIY